MRDIAAERREIEREIEGQTMCTVFKRTVERLGDADALVIGEAKLSWNAYRDRVREATLGLAGLGFTPGSFAVIMAKNRPEHLIADLGVVHARGTPVSLYNTLAPEQVSYIVNHCAATVAFVDDASFLARFRREDLPTLKHVVVLTGDAPPGTIAWADLLASGKTGTGFDELWQGVKPDDTLTLIYTSGTTGPPKGVIDTHRTTLWVLTSSRHVLATTERDRTVSYLPLAHAADRFLQHYAGIVAGHTVHFCSEITQLFATVLAVRPTVFGGVPRIWEKLHAAITAGINAEPNPQKKALLIGAIEVGRAVVAMSPGCVEATRSASVLLCAASFSRPSRRSASQVITIFGGSGAW